MRLTVSPSEFQNVIYELQKEGAELEQLVAENVSGRLRITAVMYDPSERKSFRVACSDSLSHVEMHGGDRGVRRAKNIVGQFSEVLDVTGL